MTKLVIFDCDGVLVDSEGPTSQVLSKNLRQYGLLLSPEECEANFVGGTMAKVGEEAQRLGAALPENWVDEIYEQMYERLAEGVDKIAGIDIVLDHLETVGVPCCVASNGSLQKMQITLGQTGLWDRFDQAMFSAHTLGVAKPDPGLFLAAAQHFGVSAADCLVVEDSLSGATAAQRAEMRCLAYIPNGNDQRLTDTGAEIIHRMQKVIQML